jgi:GxxExxY protein
MSKFRSLFRDAQTTASDSTNLRHERKDMDDHNGNESELKHGQITKPVIGRALEVINELGAGFLESVYENAMLLALQQKGPAAVRHHACRVIFRGECVGDFYADIFVEGKVIVELKAIKAIAPEHQAQIVNYLNATGIEVGLLINFGNPKLEYKRFTRSKDFERRYTGYTGSAAKKTEQT